MNTRFIIGRASETSDLLTENKEQSSILSDSVSAIAAKRLPGY